MCRTVFKTAKISLVDKFSQMVDTSDDSYSFVSSVNGNYRRVCNTGLLLLDVKVFDDGS